MSLGAHSGQNQGHHRIVRVPLRLIRWLGQRQAHPNSTMHPFSPHPAGSGRRLTGGGLVGRGRWLGSLFFSLEIISISARAPVRLLLVLISLPLAGSLAIARGLRHCRMNHGTRSTPQASASLKLLCFCGGVGVHALLDGLTSSSLRSYRSAHTSLERKRERPSWPTAYASTPC